jgi:phage terminase large subunit-like protein
MHPVTDYALSVVEGDIKTGKFVKWACQRHLNDLKREDVYFDEKAANRIINFYKLTPHVKGEWAGRPIILEDWQKFIVGSLFGWKRIDDTRKYREAYIEVSRKNGKTTMMAPIGLYGMLEDNEPGAEVYSAATTRDQSKEIFSPAKRISFLPKITFVF